MKNKTITLFILVLLFSQKAFAQWTSLPSGTEQDLFDIDFFDAMNGVAVGNSATLLLTTDGGSSWSPANTGELKDDFRSVLMISPDTILAAAGTRYDGRLYRSVDGGQQWEALIDVPEVAQTSLGIIGFDHESAYYSANRGKDWDTTDLHIGNTVLMEDFKFFDADTGFLVGNVSGFSTYSTYAFRTEDGGLNWAALWVFDLPNNNAWTSLAVPHPDTAYLFNNVFVNFVPGPDNQLIRMTDFYYDTEQDRNSWRFTAETVNTDMPGLMISAHFLNGSHGFAGSQEGDIYETEDGGQSWEQVYDGDTSILEIIQVDEQLLYAVGGNGLILKYALNTGTRDRDPVQYLRLYPNPVKEVLNLTDFPGPEAKATIHGIDGRLIRTFPWQAGEGIPVNELARGTYLLKMTTGSKRFMGRFLKL